MSLQKAYLQILINKWWVLIPVFLITLTATIYLTFTEVPIYETSAKYVIDLNPAVVGDVKISISAVGLISSQEAIGGTYVEYASSRSVRAEAKEMLGDISTTDHRISSRVLAGTNVLEITVTGPNPTTASLLANAVGEVTIRRVSSSDENQSLYVLTVLDEATVPTTPISPNVNQNLILGAVFGLVLGAGLALLAEYLTSNRLKEIIAMNIMDVETNALNKRYFLQRLNQEMIRAKRNQYPLSLALLKIEHLDVLEGPNNSLIRTEFLRQVVARLNQYLREEDLLAYMADDTFGILLLDTSGENAKSIIEYFQTRIAWTDFTSEISGIKLSLSSMAGIVSYNQNGVAQEEFLGQAERALRLAAVSEDGRTHLADGLETPRIIESEKNE